MPAEWIPSSLEVHALGSGSSGNATLIRMNGRCLLIDAGIGPRRLVPWLQHRGVEPGCLEGVLITHEHEDHIRAAEAVGKRWAAPVVGNRATLEALCRRFDPPFTRELPTGADTRMGCFWVRSFPVSHDAADPVGYVVETGGVRIAYATDLGCVTPEVAGALRGAHLCVLEANHDLQWLLRGPYPPHMKARVASDTGHLSNTEAAHLIARLLDEGGPAAFWLAHLSAVNNSPALARRTVSQELSRLTGVPVCLEVALRDQPSVVWRPRRPAVQGCLL
ncbi:MAG: MBL fold metallo-hydrolase [Chthonomonadales bacterium]